MLTTVSHTNNAQTAATLLFTTNLQSCGDRTARQQRIQAF
jgi:hypothetical protein